MSSIEELKAEKERLELEAQVEKLRAQKDRREAVEEIKKENWGGALVIGGLSGVAVLLVSIAVSLFNR